MTSQKQNRFGNPVWAGLLVVSLATAFAALPASAQPGREGRRFGGPAEFGPGEHGPRGMRLLRIAEELDLSEAQRESMKGIFEVHRAEIEPIHQQMGDARVAVEEALEADVVDEGTVRAAAQQAADLGVELAVLRARIAGEFRALLTPAQRETLGELRERRRQFREEHGDRGMRGMGRMGHGGRRGRHFGADGG